MGHFSKTRRLRHAGRAGAEITLMKKLDYIGLALGVILCALVWVWETKAFGEIMIIHPGSRTALAVFLSYAAIMKFGKTRLAKSRLCYYAGLVVLSVAGYSAIELTLASFRLNASSIHETNVKELLFLSRSFTLLVGSTFGASIMVRGLQYAIDEDLEKHKPKVIGSAQ